ncbi:hypothetical protein OO256_06400 [Pseudomonas sp. DCB_CB]|uniref:hypothetical protein n=1 Tax=Pseudomonas TaxID=286 RepID=UPI002248A43E|nr:MULTISPECIES: hypothetical protein [unclassified Pseudomonas]MCX2690107.1 hypothetical protein [Pseudomonas sp. DCB_BZ]MCX2855731.1 hypothetical protein [Pseudomonas sp. DCB_CB]
MHEIITVVLMLLHKSVMRCQVVCLRQKKKRLSTLSLNSDLVASYMAKNNKKKVRSAYERMTKGSLIQSPRRLLFTHSDSTIAERGFYYADTVWGWGGTGILIKFEEKFFILTAQHVISEHVPDHNFQNESPFFSHIFSKKFNSSIEEFAFPIRGWKIGQLITNDSPTIDNDDIVLIELGDLFRFPDRFIDLDAANSPQGLPLQSIFEGMYLIVSGYPAQRNEINYHYENDAPFVHTVNLSKDILLGKCVIENGFPVVKLNKNSTHDELNGMSGGIVTNLQPKPNQTEWVGLIQKAGNGYVHFYPAAWIIPAIRRFKECECYIIDPAAKFSDPHLQGAPEVIAERRRFYKDIQRITGKHRGSISEDELERLKPYLPHS